MGRSIGIALHLMKTSIVTQLMYRGDFLLQLLMSVFWAGWALVPVVVVYRLRPEIGHMRREEAMLVMSAFLLMKSVLEGVISPNMQSIVELIRRGTFDFILLKPADSQLLVSFSRVVPSKLVDGLAGIIVGAYALSLAPGPIHPSHVLLGGVLLVSGVVILYSIWLLVVTTAFWVVKMDNLSFLMGSIFDAARWPISVFRGALRAFLTFVIPVALITTFPALAALGRLEPTAALASLAAASAFFVVARKVWQWATRHYASASS
ncbi:MAG: ABC-2 family transporter protein [Myxococcota bacterium]